MFKNFIGIFLCLFFTANLFAEIVHPKQNRIGLSIVGTGRNFGVLIDYDRMDVFPAPNWSLGGEIGTYGNNLIVVSRALWRQYEDMSGFYVGPKIYFANNIFHERYNRFDRNDNLWDDNTQEIINVGIGAEGGWLYQFPQNFDLGGGVDLNISPYSIWLGLKISAGYVF